MMAKKSARKRTLRGRKSHNPTPSFDEKFPTIARWVSQEEGWVELGADHYSRSLVRALYGGGMVWEGTDDYESLDEALRAMEKGIAAWIEETRPEGKPAGEVNPARGGHQHRSVKKPHRQTGPETTGRSRTRQPSSPKSTPRSKGADRTKGRTTPPIPRAVIEKVRKFADIAEALRQDQHFEITRLTSLKSLCKDPGAARSFALFLAVHARKKVEEKKGTERVKELIDRAIKEMESYLDDPNKERKERLYPLLREMGQEQNEHKRIGWGMVRIVHSMELVVVENALRSIVRDDEAPIWLYQAARDYAERYDSRYGTGLIPSSAPMMQEIADFWREFYGIKE